MPDFQAILFDLDGTLLPHNIDEFLPRYLGLIARRMAARLPGVNLPAAIMASSEVMLRNDGSRTNAYLIDASDAATRNDCLLCL